MKKKILSLLLALCLVMALVPMTAFAEGTSVDNWDGTADISWYTVHKTDTEYHFTTAEQLAGLAQLVNEAVEHGGDLSAGRRTLRVKQIAGFSLHKTAADRPLHGRW